MLRKESRGSGWQRRANRHKHAVFVWFQVNALLHSSESYQYRDTFTKRLH